MTIELKCTGCERTLRVGDEHAGKRARCPECNTIVTVPSEAEVGYSDSAEERPESTNEGTSDSRKWFMKTPEGQTFGPVPRVDLDRWLHEGRITDDCFLRADGTQQWRNADDVYPSLRPQPAFGHARNPFTDSPNSSNPYASGARGINAVQTPHRGGLVLALGICSWIFCGLLGFVAWAMGNNDLREMREGRMDPSGMGLTQAGQIIGMLSAILTIVGILLFLFMLVLTVVLGS